MVGKPLNNFLSINNKLAAFAACLLFFFISCSIQNDPFRSIKGSKIEISLDPLNEFKDGMFFMIGNSVIIHKYSLVGLVSTADSIFLPASRYSSYNIDGRDIVSKAHTVQMLMTLQTVLSSDPELNKLYLTTDLSHLAQTGRLILSSKGDDPIVLQIPNNYNLFFRVLK